VRVANVNAVLFRDTYIDVPVQRCSRTRRFFRQIVTARANSHTAHFCNSLDAHSRHKSVSAARHPIDALEK
jgi:hypothetical protein